MRRTAPNLDRYGNPLRRPRADDYQPAQPQWSPPPWNQCQYGGDFEPRCTRIGTYKIRPDLLPTDEQRRLWTNERTRYCKEHSNPLFHVPAEDD